MAAVEHSDLSSRLTPLRTMSMKARIPQHVVYRSLVSETVMLNVETGKYYGLNQTAGRMLELLERGQDLDGAAAELAPEFGVTKEMVRDDMLALCRDLAQKGLVELEAAPEGP